jgi:hypothetical protein
VARTAEVVGVERTQQSIRVADRSAANIPVWLYPQVLSLDAAAVAVCWQWLFAKSFQVAITPAILFVTGACVWMIYAADHLLDVRSGTLCTARHRFMARHRGGFLIAAAVVFTSAAVASTRFPFSLWRGAVELTFIVGVYLALVHRGGEKVRRYWPKEFAIGAVFAAGSTIATWSSGATPVRVWPSVALFAASCTLNCCAVDYWEWQTNRVLLRYPHRATRWVARRFVPYAISIVTGGALLLFFAPNAVVVAAMASAVLLMVVGARRKSLSPELVRLLADAALLTPVLFLLR